MTDAWTVGWCWNRVDSVFWLPDEMVSWNASGELCRAIYVQRWCMSV